MGLKVFTNDTAQKPSQAVEMTMKNCEDSHKTDLLSIYVCLNPEF